MSGPNVFKSGQKIPISSAGLPPVSWQISILFILALRSLRKKLASSGAVKFYWDRQTDSMLLEGSLIAQNTSSDSGAQKTSSAEEGDEENRILLKQPFEIPPNDV